MADETKTGEQGDTKSAGTADATTTTTDKSTDTKTVDTTKTAGDATKESKAGETGKTDAKDGKATETSKVPEKYELKVPEGSTRLDVADLAGVETMARAKGWSNEEAQQAITEHVAALDAQSTRFLETTTADRQYGGDKLPETQKLAKTALDKLRPAGTPRGDALRSLLERSGYGNHIEVVSLLADLGRLMAEDRPGLQTSGGDSTPMDPADRFYGKKAS